MTGEFADVLRVRILIVVHRSWDKIVNFHFKVVNNYTINPTFLTILINIVMNHSAFIRGRKRDSGVRELEANCSVLRRINAGSRNKTCLSMSCLYYELDV